MYIWSFVAAKIGVFKFLLIIEILLMKFMINPLLLGFEDLSRILELTMSTSRLGEDCKELLNSAYRYC
jgi:hypothetical protein